MKEDVTIKGLWRLSVVEELESVVTANLQRVQYAMPGERLEDY